MRQSLPSSRNAGFNMHYYKRHLGDYAKKAGHLSPLEHGVYTLILDSYYDREQAPTLIEATRWARARTEDEKAAVLAVLDEFFTLEDDRYSQKRVEEELGEYRGKAETNRVIAVAREQRKRERRENDSTKTVAPDEHEPCTNGQPNQEPLTINQEPVKSKAPAPAPRVLEADIALFPNVAQQVVNDFKILRKQKKAAITKTAMDAIAAQASLAGLSLEDALRVCCSRGWSGFKAEWVLRDGAQPALGNTDEWKRGAI